VLNQLLNGVLNPQSIDPHMKAHDATGHPNAALPPVRIVNIVATASLGCKVNLSVIARSAKNCEYNSKRFSGLIMRGREPRATALLFESGKMVVLGTKTEEDTKAAGIKVAKTCSKLGYQVSLANFTIQNIVGTVKTGMRLALDLLYVHNAGSAIYDPEIFPGLIYRMERPAITCLLFSSGKIVLVGAKDRTQMQSAFSDILPLMHRFSLPDVSHLSRGTGS